MRKALAKLPRTVVVLGFVSLFNDLASEMVTPLIPLVLATVLGAGPLVLGLVEGVAEAVAAFLKLWAGRHSDRMGGRRKALTLAGYLLSNLVRPLLGQAGSWPTVVALRAVDRVGKGLRTAPRDALVADVTPAPIRGLAFGFHRAMDNGGAMAGSLLAAAVLAWTPLSLSQVILVSAFPGIVVVLLVAVGVREPARPHENKVVPAPPLAWSALSKGMRRFMLVLALFTFARASETFIMLRGHQLGVGVVELLLLWSALSFAKSVSSWLGGGWADRLSHRRLVFFGWIAHATGFVALALADGPAALWTAAVIYGTLTGTAEGAERALVGELAHARERGTAFGWYNLVLGAAAIPAGLLFGGVWQTFGAGIAFAMAAACAVAAVILLRLFVMPHALHVHPGGAL